MTLTRSLIALVSLTLLAHTRVAGQEQPASTAEPTAAAPAPSRLNLPELEASEPPAATPEPPPDVGPREPAPAAAAAVAPVAHRSRAGIQPLREPPSPLDQITPLFRPEKQPLERALRLLGRPFNVTFIVDADAANVELTMEKRDASLREILTAIVHTKGLYYEERAGYVFVRRNKTEFFFIEYPALKRKTSGNVSINLSAAQSNSNMNGGVQGYGGYSGGARGASLGASGAVGANGYQQQQDQSTLSITKENDGDVWDGIEKQLASLLIEGESFNINRFSGIVKVDASEERLRESIRPYIAIVNRRINRQVHIKTQVIEVDLTRTNKLGVDWAQAATTIGSTGITFSAAAPTNIGMVGPTILPSDSFTARIGVGKLDAVLTALSQQGNVHSESNPSVTTLVNQTTYIKVGEDRTFFTLNSSTEINQPTTGSGTSSARQDVYNQFTQTFGDVLEVTPSVSEDDVITLIASPTISRFKGLTTSADGRLSGPNSDSKATESIIRLRSGETGVMGGFVFTQDADDTRGIPLLERIPLVGRAFRTDGKTNRRSELAILITATLDDL